MFTVLVKQTTLGLELALLWPAWWVTPSLQALRFPARPKAVFLPSLGDKPVYTDSQASLGWAVSTASREQCPGQQKFEWQQRAWHQILKTLSSVGASPKAFSIVAPEHSSRTSMYLLLRYFGVEASVIGHSTKTVDLDIEMVIGIIPSTLHFLLMWKSHRRCQVQCLSMGD